MAASSVHPRLEFIVRYEDGTEVHAGTRVVKVLDATNAMDLDDMNTDPDGFVESGSLPVAVGTTIRVRFDYMGCAGAAEFVTTEEP